MRAQAHPASITDSGWRLAAGLAGLGLLAMIVLAPFANFYAVDGVIVPGNGPATLSNLVAAGGLFRQGIAAFLAVALLDVIVAWALHGVFAPANARLSQLAAWLRVTYAATFVVALAPLLSALRLAGSGDIQAALGAEATAAHVLLAVNAFNNTWTLGLGVFGLHLLVLGAVAFGSGYAPRWVGSVLVIAGAGYLVDTFAKVLAPTLDLSFLMVTFFGEALFMVWLLWRSARGARAAGDNR